MNEHHLEPLDAETRELLLAEKAPSGAPAHRRDRVLAKLQASIASPGGVGESPRPDVGIATRAAAGKVTSMAVVFVVGGLAGAAVDRWLVPPLPPRIVYVPVASPTAPEPHRDTIEIPPEMPSTRPPAAASRAAGTPSAESDLGAERALLDRARAAFAAADYAAALTAVASHAKRFPGGHLQEEREALAVKALVGAGRYDEAKARGARFRTRFPNSFLAPTIDEALRTIP
jgi:hypothetical protein